MTLSLGLVALYIWMAVDTFESDKIYYIFENSQSQLETQGRQISENVERLIFDSKSILATVDTNLKDFSPLGKKFFEDSKNIISLRIWDDSSPSPLLQLSKNQVEIPETLTKDSLNEDEIRIEALPHQNFRILFQPKIEGQGHILIDLIVNLSEAFEYQGQGTLLWTKGNEILAIKGENSLSSRSLDEVLESLNKDRVEKTSLLKIDDREFLLSSTLLKYGNFRLTFLQDKDSALAALSLLAHRSKVFVVFSAFIMGILAYFLSLALTRNLNLLTSLAEKIGQGKFDLKFSVNSRDEVGTLAKAFRKMTEEIMRLLEETKTKARMEEELKTSRLVQESFFPEQQYFTQGSLSFCGRNVTMTECGGDWWHYFRRGDDLFVVLADATGHGTPAALMTAAARSLFSKIENSNTSLEEMATDLNRAIATCSNKKVFMTALLIQINAKTGEYKAINASHDPPFILRQNDDQLQCEPLLIQISPTLAEQITPHWKVHQGQIAPGERLFLYTDGLFQLEDKNGVVVREKKLMEELKNLSTKSETPTKLIENIFQYIDATQTGKSLKDDIAILVIDRQKSSSWEARTAS